MEPTYTAEADTFCLALPAASAHRLAEQSAPFADFLNRRVQQLLDLSRRTMQVAYASQSLAEQSLETPLGDLLRRAAFAGSWYPRTAGAITAACSSSTSAIPREVACRSRAARNASVNSMTAENFAGNSPSLAAIDATPEANGITPPSARSSS